MFCPKCGAKTLADDQRFCKSCGTNLQAVNDVLERGDSKTTVLGVDIGGIVKSVKESIDVDGIAKTVKESVADIKVNQDTRKKERRTRRAQRHGRNYDHWLEYEQIKTKVEEEKAKRQQLRMPKPKEWMSYSWQHNLKQGLMSLFGGAGSGVFLYFLGKIAIESGLLAELALKMEVSYGAIEPVARMLWLIALISVLKGVGQIFYAAFFAESMATLTERFATRPLLDEKPEEPEGKFLFANLPSKDTAPQAEPAPVFDDEAEPPPSVTETTTRTLEEARARSRGRYE